MSVWRRLSAEAQAGGPLVGDGGVTPDFVPVLPAVY